MHQFSCSLNCVCLGVGAAFEFLSGEKVFPPVWVQRLGLTWLVRLCQEPRRLAKRNLYSPIFVAMFLRQQIFGRLGKANFLKPIGSEASTRRSPK
jgi:N-acetylglucosaminyldiphosphoundecaprenol N-acetyl-beta-D-mannosaminyltransferase